jgi:hypothetical protein
MSWTKRLLLLSLFCGLCVVVLVNLEPVIISYVIGESEFAKKAVVGLLSVLILTAALIPLGMWMVAVSDFGEKTMEDSILYSNKKDEPKE